MTNNDQDAARRRRNFKCLAYVLAGVIAQTAIIVLFVMLVMRIRNPKVRLGAVIVESLGTNTSATSPSFTIKLNAQVTVKNTNFGHFKFQNTTATISYRGTLIGEATIVKARARARSTKKFNVTFVASSGKVSSNSQLGDDIESGIIPLSSHARLDGKIILFKVFKKKKSAEMNCTVDVNTTTKEIQNLKCK
ncbi:hypothetical protein SLA2020_060010 [Shorea laevis]